MGSNKGSSNKLKQEQGRVFNTTRREADKPSTIVIGTLPILGYYALVLFDSGLSHLFISFVFVKHVM